MLILVLLLIIEIIITIIIIITLIIIRMLIIILWQQCYSGLVVSSVNIDNDNKIN